MNRFTQDSYSLMDTRRVTRNIRTDYARLRQLLLERSQIGNGRTENDPVENNFAMYRETLNNQACKDMLDCLIQQLEDAAAIEFAEDIN